jgi:hypothetical protein
MSDLRLINPSSGNQRASHQDKDESSMDTSGSFVGDVDVCEVESINSFVGYIEGVHSFPSSGTDNAPISTQVDDVDYSCTVATSQSTEDTPDASESSSVSSVVKPFNGSKKYKKKGLKRVVSSVRCRLCCPLVKPKK